MLNFSLLQARFREEFHYLKFTNLAGNSLAGMSGDAVASGRAVSESVEVSGLRLTAWRRGHAECENRGCKAATRRRIPP
jgi:hypothetical protein